MLFIDQLSYLKKTLAIYNEVQSDNYSIKSIKWMKFLSERQHINIQHALNGREVCITTNDGKRLKVDGYCKENNTVYQFQGCYFHGCKQCYNDLTINEVNNTYMHILYQKTKMLENAIVNSGYNLVTIWEHEFDKNKEMKQTSLSEYDLVEPPKVRDAFFGGRTEPFKLIKEFNAENNEKGKYIDICSLYPTVMYNDPYPIGHPKIIIKPKEYDENWFGLIYCKVLPPKNLYIPVLPYKQKTQQSHKLLFGLCRTCMNNLDIKCNHFNRIKCSDNCKAVQCKECKNTKNTLKNKCGQCYNLRNSLCTHTDSERMITGFWCTNEIQKAIEKGYKIILIYEV
jgi:hypothetical protein